MKPSKAFQNRAFILAPIVIMMGLTLTNVWAEAIQVTLGVVWLAMAIGMSIIEGD